MRGVRPSRVDGYAGIEDYAIVADGRVTALVARDGSIDWFAQPTMDQPTTFAALLDPERGGRFELRPEDDFTSSRRYLPRTNVLETTFATAGGRVKVTDALTMQSGGLVPWIELVRSIECVSGRVPLRWRVEPRFDYGRQEVWIRRRNGTPVAAGGRSRLAVFSWDAGEQQLSADAIFGRCELREGDRALLVCVGVDAEPIPLPPRGEIEARLGGTCRSWRQWVGQSTYEGPWTREVQRSALALKALTYAPSGAMSAAATTGLPEIVGGDRNYDYRFMWLRDSTFAIDALSRMGFHAQVHESLSWLLAASASTHQRMEPFYALDGHVPKHEQELPLAGWRRTGPVRKGNDAIGQLQLGNFGDLLETIRLYCYHGNVLDDETATRVVEICNLVCELWQNEDSGFWELPDRRHYTFSKIAVWGAIDRALGLHEMGQVDLDTETIERWQREQEAIRQFVDSRCWSEARRAYAFHAGSDSLDATLLLNTRVGFVDPAGERMQSTIDAIRDELSAGGPLLYRFSDMRGKEGAFVACSFWLVTALARAGRLDEARKQMEAMLALANDVGLYSEEIDPESHAFLGNFPQALSHLALIDAAHVIHEIESTGMFPARAAEEVSR